jgi:hypothetical protein
MPNNTSSTSRTTEKLNRWEVFGREQEVEGAKWKRALAIAGYTGDNIVQLRPRNTTPALEAAMGYVLFHGWDVFPADVEEKKSHLSAEFAPEHKPWGMTNDTEQLRRNFLNAKWRLKCGVGVPTGWVNRIFDIEADTLEGHGVDGLASLQELEAKHGKLPDTRMAESPSGSEHRIYNHPGRGIKVKSSDIAPGVDIKGDGGMFVAPPSVRSDGAYRWLNDLPIADAPQWLIDLVTEPIKEDAKPSAANIYEQQADKQMSRAAWAAKALRNVANELRDTDKGTRNHKLYKCAFRLGTMVAREWIARDVVERELEDAAKVCGLVDDGRAAVRATIKSGIEGGLKCPHDDLPVREDAPSKENGGTLKAKLMQTSAEFVAGFVPPDYLIDGLLQRRYVYSLTAPTGSGKTAIALLIAIHVARGMSLAGQEVEKGRVLFFAGENPDDVRTRWILLCEKMGEDPDTMDVVFMPFTVNLSEKEIREQIDEEAGKHGPFSLLIVDTSASYYSGNDENDNVALGNHARMLRTFVELPGGPTILVTCHPTKTPNMENLLPRGGGAFLAEVDGNLVCLKDTSAMVVEVTTHGKFRGPEFAPFSFKLARSQSEKLIDSKGRMIWSIFAQSITSEEREAIEEAGHVEQDELLRAMLDQPGRSLVQLAEHLLWLTMKGDPNKTKVYRMMRDLQKIKLVEQRRDGHYVLTDKGQKEAEKTPEDPIKTVKPD